jgi:hypothetical protein
MLGLLEVFSVDRRDGGRNDFADVERLNTGQFTTGCWTAQQRRACPRSSLV